MHSFYVPVGGATCAVFMFRCYKCDDEVQLEQSKRLQESVDIIRKQAGLPQAEPGQYMSLSDRGGGGDKWPTKLMFCLKLLWILWWINDYVMDTHLFAVRKQSQSVSSTSVVEQAFKPSTSTPRSSGMCSKVKVSNKRKGKISFICKQIFIYRWSALF